MTHDSVYPRSGDDPAQAIQAEAQAWVRKLAAGSPTTADAEDLKYWCAQSAAHEQAWRQARGEWQAMGEVLLTHRARHPAPAAKPQRPSRRLFLGAGASAVTALAVVAVVRPPLGLWPSWSELGADYRTATGEQRDVQLGEHIRVALNTQTSIAVQGQGARPRIELIAGEAEVLADGVRALEVVAGAGHIDLAQGCVQVRQLGGDRVRLACTQGHAQLHHGARSLPLQAGQQVVYDLNTVSGVAPVAAQAVSAWRDGMVDFDNTPVAEAVAEINRYRPGRVVLMNDALAQRRISGRFNMNALEEAIVMIEQLYQAKVRRLGDVVLLS
ncbi:Fe2+-dicitrate sensor, membrane component [Pusillimonas sp. T7-7]|uniref:FecR family protein n=1 Tax=Pusillimonas sp. (strain T7-7) TaxID=1007105 RepID=UPI0002084AF8|nr:FecR domain-containing protein [Pusillimonas sp. T7-7]AEC18820.1 Fe2+-dicitrate sensor, membrane component [Pusillimonas sp. T7-7]